MNMAHFFRYQPPQMISAYKPIEVTTGPLDFPLSRSVLLQKETQFTNFLVSLEISDTLLTPRQRRMFKPMVIQALGLHELPTRPYKSYEAMQNECEPVQLKWQFGPMESFNSRVYKQEKNISMDEIQVILTGLYDNDQLRELFIGTPLVIDLYDRTIRKYPRTRELNLASTETAQSSQETRWKNGDALFGTELNDSRFDSIDPTLEPLAEFGDKNLTPRAVTVDRHPFGKVVIYLDELLLLRQNRLEADFPVLPVSETNLDLTTELRTQSENPRAVSRDYVGYLDSDCSLSVRVEFNFEYESWSGLMDSALGLDRSIKDGQEAVERFIVIYERACENNNENEYDDLKVENIVPNISACGSTDAYPELLFDLIQFIVQTNARALHLPTDESIEKVQRLIRRKMRSLDHVTSSKSFQQSISTDRNVAACEYNSLISGFHLTDPNCHVLVIEAIDVKTRDELNERLENFTNPTTNVLNRFHVMQNTSLRFTQRLYLRQDWSFSEIRLLVPIEDLLGQPLFHVRDLLPRKAYCAANRIQALKTLCHTLMEATHADLFPTVEMLEALARDFAVPVMLTNSISRVTSACGGSTDLQKSISPRLDSDFISNDLKTIKKKFTSSSLKKSALRRPWTTSIKKDGPIRPSREILYRSSTLTSTAESYNYSNQLLGSSRLARMELFDQLSRTCSNYTYSHQFLHSGGFEQFNEPLDFISTLRRSKSNCLEEEGSTRRKKKKKWRRDPDWNIVGLETRVGFKAHMAKYYRMTEI